MIAKRDPAEVAAMLAMLAVWPVWLAVYLAFWPLCAVASFVLPGEDDAHH